MFGTIRKHKTWLWGIIIAGTVVSFVVFFSPNTGLGPAQGGTGTYVSPASGRPVTMFGKQISHDEFEKTYKETTLFYFIRSGKWPETDENAKRRLEADTLYRLLLIKRAKDLDIHVSPEAVAHMTLRRLGDYPYPKFVEQVLKPAGLSSADFERFAHDETVIQQLASVVTTPALLISAPEAEVLYRQDNQEVKTEVAAFWATNFLDQVKVTPEQIHAYFTNREAFYRTPPRVVVNYVEFPASNYLAQADTLMAERTNLNAAIEDEYYKQGTNTFTDTNGVVLSAEQAKAKIKEDIREQFALVEGRKKASAFGTVLYDLPDPNEATNLIEVAAKEKLAVHTTPPFSYSEGLDEDKFPQEFRSAALKLTRSNPVHFMPIVGDKAVYVLALKTNLPSQPPVFEQVKEKVTADYRRDQSMQMALMAGRSFYQFLTNGLAQEKSFKALCAERKVTTLSPPPFSASTRSLTNLDERLNLRLLQQHALDLKKGEASPFARTQDGGIIVYLEDRLPVPESQVKEALPDFMATMRNARFSDIFNGWLRKQVELAQLVIPQREAVTAPARGATPGKGPGKR